MVASAVGIDAQSWKVTRVVVSEQEPTGREPGAAYQVLCLAKPLLSELPTASAREPQLAS